MPCCTTLAGLPFKPLPADRVELITAGEESPVFDFDTGRSYVVALELPSIEPPYIVQVRSYALGDLPQRSRVFYPAALLLEERHEVLARREPENLPVVKTRYGDATRENRWGLPLRLAWDILVDEPGTRYLVLHTTEQGLAGRFPDHKAICADCNKECEVPFKPSGDRPVYCKSALRNVRTAP